MTVSPPPPVAAPASPSPQHALRVNSALEAAKWGAIITMVMDHVGFLLADNMPEMRFVGRIACPLFCWVIAVRLAEGPSLAPRYLPRFIWWGLISQIPFWLAFYPDKHLFSALNIMATLGLGVWCVWLTDQAERNHAPAYKALLWCGVVLALVAGGRCDYGPLGVAAIPILTRLSRPHLKRAAYLLGPLGFAVNLAIIWPYLPEQMETVGVASGALLATPLALFCLKAAKAGRLSVPRLPGWFFYAFYPAHLFLLVLYGSRLFGLIPKPV